MQKYAVIDSSRCERCKDCLAATACPHNLIEQESHGEIPIHWSRTMCVGCGKCVAACSSGAISIERG